MGKSAGFMAVLYMFWVLLLPGMVWAYGPYGPPPGNWSYPPDGRAAGGRDRPASLRVERGVDGSDYVLRIAFAGMDPDGVRIYPRGNRLVLEVVRGDGWRMRMRRTIRVPRDADLSNVSIVTHDGVKEIHFPRRPAYRR